MKRDILCNDHEHGGLRMFDLHLFSYAQKSIWVKGTNGRQKTYEIFHVYCIFYAGFICQTTVIFGITNEGSLAFYPLAS